MASSQELKHITRSYQTQESTNINKEENSYGQTRSSLISHRPQPYPYLCFSILTLGNIILFGRCDYIDSYRTLTKPIWWGKHLMCVVFSIVMGLSAWLVWAERPNAAAICLAYLGLSLAWDPIIFGLGASPVGLLVCLGLLGSVVGCYRNFKGVNPIAGGLVKPCMAWAGFLSLLNLKVVYF